MSGRIVEVAVPSVAHKGPNDTDAKFFRQVADRLEREGTYIGGSNVRAAVSKLLRSTADALEVGDQWDMRDLPPKPDLSGWDGLRKPLAFLVQCAVCPQRALVAAQPSGDWVCPRCAEVVDPDDEWPVSKVCG